MKLTPEQIAAFEARAEAGEKPTEGFWETMPALGPPAEYCPRLPFGTLCKVYDWEWADGGTEVVVDGRIVHFSSIIAAQLAVEHLLREATRGLHAEAYRNLEDLREWAEKQAQAARSKNQ